MGDEGDPAVIAKNIHVPTYDEILEKIKSRYPKTSKSLMDKELSTIQRTYDIAISKTDFIRDLVRLLDNLHPFYWRLIEIDFDRKKIHNSIKCISKARKMASKFFEKYKYIILASENRRELIKAGSEARGRILSGFKKCRRELGYIRNLVIFLEKLPSINPYLPILIVAGAPSSGKSTFVRNITRATPKVAPYPFTTTRIHIGHIQYGNIKIQVIDTPGLLDRPLEEMNEIEQRAVAALKELNGVVLFLVDVSGEAYIDTDRQIKLLLNISDIIKNKKIIIGINKIDIADPKQLSMAKERSKRLIESGFIDAIFEFSAVKKPEAQKVAENIIKKYFTT